MERAAAPGAVREERLRRWIGLYAGAVKKTCYGCLKDWALSEDAMQETFFKAWKSMDAFERKGIENEKAWLLRIAVNVARDYRRSAWLRHEDRWHDPEEAFRNRPAPEKADGGLAEEILRLPGKFRRPLLLYYYQGMTLEETAAILRTTKSTVHRRLEKARTMLRERMPGGESDEG